MKNSLCFGIYNTSEQIGFARVVTDKATFAYLAYVFIIAANRGNGFIQMAFRNDTCAPRIANITKLDVGTT